MTKPTKHATIKTQATLAGYYHAVVKDRHGRIVRDYGEQKNLILPGGYNDVRPFEQHLHKGRVGTGSTPNSAAIDGTFSQTGTTLTRVTGTGTFISANVNDFVKFDTGEIAKILSVTNTTTVEVDRSQEVAATGLTIYDTSRLDLDSTSKSASDLSRDEAVDGDAGTVTFTAIWDFDFETSPITYTEVGSAAATGTLFSRVVLDTPISVDTDQFLQLTYKLVCVVGSHRVFEPLDVQITGWPWEYAINGITADGTKFDVQLAEDHHYVAGREIIISGALPVKTDISGLTSTASEFTVETVAAHGRSVGENIVIEGATPTAYNGTWTVASVPTTTTLTVTSGINPGAGSGGTVRLETPATWFDGTWTVASVPTASSVRVTSAINPPDAGGSGTLTNIGTAKAIVTGAAFDGAGNATNYSGVLDNTGVRYVYTWTEAGMKTGLQNGLDAFYSAYTSRTEPHTESYNADTRTQTYQYTIPSAEGNGDVKQIAFQGGRYSGSLLFVEFDEPQIKKEGYQLKLTYQQTWDPDLS